LKQKNSAQLPSAGDVADQRIRPAEWKLVEECRQEAMPPGKRDIPVVDLRIAEVGNDTTGFRCETRRVVALSVRQIPEKRIAALELHSMGQPLCYGCRQAVIVAATT